ncbi:MAG: formate--tetrahydrofolate ligase [Candidatus Saccharicenans sp.]|jgi:formate--tetrahydrofolate ligase|nr:formate--tetrahydrofolate ligase [Candidatus Saccharicenans sp.]MDH7575979.1 formate--tetrahydrofolate ligase [Candidatus Saccharicenans sp.]
MKPINEIAARLGIPEDKLELYGRYKAKIDYQPLLSDKKGRLIMVTAMTPTPAGEGKTTTAIGLADALNRLGKKVCVTLREPSLGPVFGIKGGATGGGKAMVVPREEINLHFTGDIHAVTSAHNLLAAMVDNRVHFDGPTGLLDGRTVTWKRVLDMNDRSLRQVIIGLDDTFQTFARETGFDITAASEIMAILCLSSDLKDLKRRVGNVLIGFSVDGKPVFARDIKADGAMTALLKDAIKPNLVQTLEGTPAIIHGGPFANIAHGTNSVVATGLALSLADYVVTETGFASDLGAEKFFDIVVRTGQVPPPAVTVLVSTLRALKYHGGMKLDELGKENPQAVEAGFDNLRKHIENMKIFGTPFVVVLNLFPADHATEIDTWIKLVRAEGARYALSDVYNKGGEGGLELAEAVMKAIDEDKNNFNFLYPLDIPIAQKVETIARKIYGADGIKIEPAAKKKMELYEKIGFGQTPVCVAKTQSSLSDDSKKLGRPRGWTLTVTNASLSAGAGFVVLLCGDIMTMPGLPKSPQAEKIDVDDEGKITGMI